MRGEGTPPSVTRDRRRISRRSRRAAVTANGTRSGATDGSSPRDTASGTRTAKYTFAVPSADIATGISSSSSKLTRQDAVRALDARSPRTWRSCHGTCAVGWGLGRGLGWGGGGDARTWTPNTATRPEPGAAAARYNPRRAASQVGHASPRFATPTSIQPGEGGATFVALPCVESTIVSRTHAASCSSSTIATLGDKRSPPAPPASASRTSSGDPDITNAFARRHAGVP